MGDAPEAIGIRTRVALREAHGNNLLMLSRNKQPGVWYPGVGSKNEG